MLPRWCFTIYTCQKGKSMANYDFIFIPNSRRSMLLWLFATSFLHLRQACQLFLSIVYCVHLHSITWWCSWLLQRLQIFGFSSCNVVMKKLPSMVMLVFFLNIVCQTLDALDSSFLWQFFITHFFHLCSFLPQRLPKELWNV